MELCNYLKIEVSEIDLSDRISGLYCDGQICLNKSKTSTEKRCILAEEVGHALTSIGDILDQKDLNNARMEARAMAWAYEKLLPLDVAIEAGSQGIRNKYQLAEYLSVTEEFIEGAITYYRKKYGMCIYYKGYLIGLDPLTITKLAEDNNANIYIAEEDK